MNKPIKLPKVVLISGKAQHGKDTLATRMKETLECRGKKVLIIHYADYLKWVCTTYFGWDGKKDENGRALLQRIGTDVIRMQDPDFWVTSMISIIKFFPDEWDWILIPDCRFPNEIREFKRLMSIGASDIRSTDAFKRVYHIRVDRGKYFDNGLTEEQNSHISETGLDEFRKDILVRNYGTLKEYYRNVDLLIRALVEDANDISPFDWESYFRATWVREPIVF